MLKKYSLTYKLSELHKNQLHALYKKEWWSTNRSKKDVNSILQGSSFIIGIVEQSTDALVGFARILTDYFKYAYIYDVIIDNRHRGKGLGKLIMHSIIKHPKLKDIKNLELTCRTEVVQFYEQYGFSRNYDSVIPMKRTNPKVKVS